MAKEIKSFEDSASFIKEMIRYLPSKLVPIIIGIISYPIITRLFNPDIYGIYILTITISNLLVIIPNTIWGASVRRFYSSFKNQSTGTFFWTVNASTIIGLIIITIVSFSVLFAVKNRLETQFYYMLILGIIIFFLTSIFSVLLSIANAMQKANIFSIFTVCCSSTGIIIGLLLIYIYKIGIEGLLYGGIISLVLLIPALFFLVNKYVEGKKTFSKGLALSMILFGTPLIITNISAWILNLSNRYIIEYYYGSYEVGIFSAGFGFTEMIFSSIWSLFILVCYPLVVDTWECTGKQQTIDLIKKFTSYFLLIGVPSVIGISVLSDLIVVVFLGAKYTESYLVVPFIAMSMFLLGLQWWAQLGLVLNKKTGLSALIFIICGIINIVLNLLLLPYYGYAFSAIAMLISYLILLFLVAIISNRFLEWDFPLHDYIKIAIASLLMGLTIMILKTNAHYFMIPNIATLLLCVIVGLSVYGIIILIFNRQVFHLIKRIFIVK